jgi:hypothetical protein
VLPNVLVFSVPNKYQQNEELKNFLLEKRIKNHFQNKKIQILVQKRFKFWNGSQENIQSSMYLPLYLMRNHLRFKGKVSRRKGYLRFLRFRLRLIWREIQES